MRRLLAASFLAFSTIAPALADPTGDVMKAFAGLQGVSSYHMTFAGKQQQKGEIDVANPDRRHLVMGPVEVIMIGSATYVNNRGSWMKLPSAMPAMQNAIFSYIQNFGAHPQDVDVVDQGTKTVEGVSYHAYRVTPKDNKAVTVYLNGSGLPARVDTDDASVTFTNFNAPVKIEAPI